MWLNLPLKRLSLCAPRLLFLYYCSVLSSVNPVNEILKFTTELTSAVTFAYCPVVTHLWQCPSMVRWSHNQHRMFCAELLVQPEEIVLCTMSTQSDPQLLPYIWALQLSCDQLLIENSYWICMHTPPMLLWSCSVNNMDWLYVLFQFIPDNATSKYRLISQGNPGVFVGRTDRATPYHSACVHHSTLPPQSLHYISCSIFYCSDDHQQESAMESRLAPPSPGEAPDARRRPPTG